jgi:release factor glutamine methyltransferase
MSEIYEPAEDSYLLVNVLKKYLPKLIERNSDLKLLEVGCGSGIQIKNILGLEKENIFCCDINPEAVEKCKELEVNCVLSNLFENIVGKFNVIIFNPPYLPENKNEPKDSQLVTTGGKQGSELINKFLRQAKKHLENNGQIFLLTSSLTQGISFEGYEINLIAKKKIFFEELFVWRLNL